MYMEFKEFFKNFDAPEIKSKPFNYQKLRGNLAPEMDATRSIPINIDNDSYELLNKYATSRFELASDLLSRRVKNEELMASNVEIADLLALSKTIATNSNSLSEIKTINNFIDKLTTH